MLKWQLHYLDLVLFSPIRYNLARDGKLNHKTWWCTNWFACFWNSGFLFCCAVSSQAHTFSTISNSVCMIQTSCQFDRKPSWTVNRAKGNIIIRGTVQHGTQTWQWRNSKWIQDHSRFQFYWRLSLQNVVYFEDKGETRLAVSTSFLLLSHVRPKNIAVVPTITFNKTYFLPSRKWMWLYSFPHWFLSSLL